jgi:copper resistance protein B
MKALLPIVLLAGGAPALAQPMDHAMDHPAVTQPAATPPPQAPAESAGHDQAMPGMSGMTMPGMGASAPAPADSPSGEPTGTDQPPGSAEPPPVAHDHPGDRYWNPADMRTAEEAEMNPRPPRYAKLLFDLAEYQFRNGHDGYRWEGEAWVGDLDRFVIKSKGEGTVGEGLDHAELQALYSKALDPWWNLQVGVRQDFRPRPARTWATLGLEGIAPYLFEVEAAAFLSDEGELTGRLEVIHDDRITQRLILQSRVEFDLAAQDMPDQRIGSGLSTAELGLRLRYQIRPKFAPYVGVSWTWAAGTTAEYARADGRDTVDRSLVAGIYFWL